MVFGRRLSFLFSPRLVRYLPPFGMLPFDPTTNDYHLQSTEDSPVPGRLTIIFVGAIAIPPIQSA
uniref:Uncharacterized protein n=1 Tax=Oryza barthii TaxID=65489 RepID=A0A0D3HV51_9ORYZ